MSTRPRFEKEAKGNLEMAYYPGHNKTLFLLWRLQSKQDYTNPNRTLGFDKTAGKTRVP